MKRIISLLASFLLIWGPLIHATPEQDKKDGFQRCKQWLVDETSYKAFVEAERIHEYMDSGEYNLRANVVVRTVFDEVVTVGFNCEVYMESGRVAAYTDTKLFESEPQKSKEVQKLEEHRISHGASGCPSVKQWKTFAEAVDAGDYNTDLSPSCKWLEKGTKVFGPIQRVPYPSNDFVQIKLSDGTRLWVEDGAF